MVQSSTFALLAAITLCAVSPSIAAPVSSTTTSAATSKTPVTAPAVPAWVSQEEKLLMDLASMESYYNPAQKPPTVNGNSAAQNNAVQPPKQDDKKPTSTTTTTTGTPKPTPKVDDTTQKKVNNLQSQEVKEGQRIAELEKKLKLEETRLSSEKSEVQKLQQGSGAGTTTTNTPSGKGNSPPPANPPPANPAPAKVDNNLAKNLAATNPSPNPTPANPATPASQQNRLQQAEYKVVSDLEKLIGYQPTAPRDFEEGNWVRGYDNSQNDARDFNEPIANWVRRYEDAVNEARSNLDDENWVRGFDNSENDARDFEDDVEFVRDDEPESFERDFDDDEFYQRNDFEELEDLE